MLKHQSAQLHATSRRLSAGQDDLTKVPCRWMCNGHVYAYVYVRVCVCMYGCVFVCMCLVSVCVCVFVSLCTSMSMWTWTWTSTIVYVRACVYTHTIANHAFSILSLSITSIPGKRGIFVAPINDIQWELRPEWTRSELSQYCLSSRQSHTICLTLDPSRSPESRQDVSISILLQTLQVSYSSARQLWSGK